MREIEALPVVDASMLPELPSVPTTVTTIMLAERIAAVRVTTMTQSMNLMKAGFVHHIGLSEVNART